jgi:hypothetical protein
MSISVAPRFFSLHYGANQTIAGRYPQVNGESSSGQLSVLGVGNESSVLYACVAYELSWRSAAADGTTIAKLVVNGVAGAGITLTGVEGAVAIDVDIPADAQVAIEFDAGTAPGQVTWVLGCIG